MKTCKQCKKKFQPVFSSMQKTCSATCAIKWAQSIQDKEFKAETRRMKRDFNENDLSYQLKELQKEFNKCIRLRDHAQCCISCDRKTGAKENAGHYRSVGACPELRFEPLNVHLQCEHCNSHKSGNAIEYRIRLVEKIGEDNVKWLEGPHELPRLRLDEVKAMRKHYKAEIKKLEAQITAGEKPVLTKWGGYEGI